MKKVSTYIASLSTAALLAVGCYPEVLTPDQSKLPSASDFDVEIVVDQETNYVTFNMKNAGMVPMWIFGDVKIDKNANKMFAYTQNGVSLRFRDAGEHTVEVKAYNAHGVSLGSQTYTFTLENTFRDPFDPTPYMKAIAGEWVWNKDVAGHFGCGSSLANATDWWSCGANEKADWSLYNDRLTFTEDGTYMFDPGEDGKVYVNKDFTGLGNAPAGEDFLVDIPAYQTTYSIENNWNEAGIEEIWLVLPEKTNLSYIPNNDIYNNPRFIFENPVFTVTEITETRLVLASFSSSNDNPDGIAWQYIFKARDVAAPEQPVEVVDWVAEDSADNLMNSGALALNNFWWANDSWSQIADPDLALDGNKATITVNETSGGSQWQGQAHFRTGVAIEEGKAYDFKIVINPTVDIAGATVKPHPEGDDGHFFSEGRHDLLAYEDNVITYENVVANFATENLVITLDFPGCPAGTVINVKGIIIQEHRGHTGGGSNTHWVDENSAENLMNGGALALNNFWWANDGWSQIADPTLEMDGNKATITVNETSGGSQWQGQAHFRTGVAIEEGKAYDFKIVINPTADLAGATVKPHPTGDDGHFFSEARHDLVSYEDNAVTYENVVANFTTTDLVITLDFPGCAAGTVIKVGGIIIQEHK